MGFLILSRGEAYGWEEWVGAVNSVNIVPYMRWFGVKGMYVVGEDDTFAGEADPLRGWW